VVYLPQLVQVHYIENWSQFYSSLLYQSRNSIYVGSLLEVLTFETHDLVGGLGSEKFEG